ncbi:MAG: chemotaxis protein CheA [Pseudomonadota bacterium]
MMSGVDDDIRADFLVEAGELVDRLGEQLVELENRPDDLNLLNAIFRAFHTVKGGAGFLVIPELVEVCHRAEELFGVLRSGKRKVDAALMDAALAALDEVQRMMDCVRRGQAPAAASPALLQTLKDQLTAGAVVAPAPKPAAVAVKPVEAVDAADAEFEQLLAKAAPASVAVSGSDTISDDEFEALLDQLHGSGKAATEVAPVAVEVPAPVEPAPAQQQRRASDHAPDTSVRVDTHKLDALMNLVGELVLVRNRLKTLRAQISGGAGNEKAVSELDAITSRLQGSVLTLRMQPIRKVFSRFPKLVRDISRGLGKEINVVLVGEDTDLDKNLVDALGDPLMHMVRNSCDHGVEMPDARAANGKPRAGTLTLSAQQQGDHILITVRDDGAGIDPERLRNKVVEKGLMAAADAARLDAQAALELIFMPGFSTKEQVTDLSGRGVGMDVVKSSITALNGMVQIESRVGVGTTFRLRVPLTLAILPTLMVTVGPRIYAVPLPSVFEVSALNSSQVRWLDRKPVLLLRDESLRLIDLGRWVNPQQADDAFMHGDRHVVVVRINDDRYGLLVDEVLGREEVVIKPLGALLKGLAGFAGATVTGDGGVALILDVASLVKAHENGN